MVNGKWQMANGSEGRFTFAIPFSICHERTPPPRRTTGVTTAQNRDRLGLLPFGPDPVHGRPLHRPRPSSATASERRIVGAIPRDATGDGKWRMGTRGTEDVAAPVCHSCA